MWSLAVSALSTLFSDGDTTKVHHNAKSDVSQLFLQIKHVHKDQELCTLHLLPRVINTIWCLYQMLQGTGIIGDCFSLNHVKWCVKLKSCNGKPLSLTSLFPFPYPSLLFPTVSPHTQPSINWLLENSIALWAIIIFSLRRCCFIHRALHVQTAGWAHENSSAC